MSMVDGNAARSNPQRLMNEQVEPERLALRRMVATKGEYLVYQLLGPLSGCEDMLQRLPGRAGLCHLLLCKLGEADDNLQDVVEVVGDAAGQRPDGFHLLGLAQLGFEVSVCSDVAKHHHRAMEHPAPATNRRPAVCNRYLAAMPGDAAPSGVPVRSVSPPATQRAPDFQQPVGYPHG